VITLRTQALAVAVLGLAACARSAVKINPAETAAMNTRWHGMLAAPSDLAGVTQVSGTAWFGPGDKQGTTEVSISLTNAAPGGIHPWAVHIGSCGNDQGVFGTPDAYQPLKVGSDGKATATTTMPVATPQDGSYFVIAYAAPSNMSTTFACGNMAPPTP
jgi:hypothetical protein